MRNMGWLSFAGVVVLLGCGGDDESAARCPTGTLAGQTVACMCDATTTGAQMCGTDGFLTDCMCGPGAMITGGAGGMTSTATGGTSGAGAGGAGGTTTTGGTGGSMPPAMDDDAGMTMGGGGDGGVGGMGGGTMAPMDGNQNALCESGLDCNKGLDCYLPSGVGTGYCTIPCSGDMACDVLMGADYTCSPEGLCRVVCGGMDDKTSCPDGMVCQGGFGPGGGRCNWPASGMMAGSTPAYGECTENAACEDGLQCALPSAGPLPGGGGGGYCTKSCTKNTDCPKKPATGMITPSCEPNGLMMEGVCALDCFGVPDGCPDGMTCKSLLGGVYRRCLY